MGIKSRFQHDYITQYTGITAVEKLLKVCLLSARLPSSSEQCTEILVLAVIACMMMWTMFEGDGLIGAYPEGVACYWHRADPHSLAVGPNSAVTALSTVIMCGDKRTGQR